jgi:hypothetical protein
VQPQAAAIFVRGFGEQIIQSNTITAESSMEIQEIMAVSVTLTVRNNPGSFNITISDNENKFILPDDPQGDISAFYKYSRGKIVSEQTNSGGDPDNSKPAMPKFELSGFKNAGGIVIAPSMQDWFTNPTAPGNSSTVTYSSNLGNFYEFKNYTDWATFGNVIITDETGKKYPTQYIRNTCNNIIERWAFLGDGTIVYLCKNSDDEISLQNQLSSGSISASFKVDTYYNTLGKTPSTQVFSVQKVSNSVLTERYRDVLNQGSKSGQFLKGKCKIAPMDRVILFMSPRFNADGTFNEGNTLPLVQVFTGVVNSVQQGYSENTHTISVQGEDVTKYLKISIVNVNPALDIGGGNNVDQNQDQHLNVWSSIFEGLTTPDIIRLLCLGTGNTRKGSKAMNQTLDGVGFYEVAAGDSTPYTYDIKTNTFTPTDQTSTPVQKVDFSKMLGTLFGRNSVHIIDPFRTGANGGSITGLQGFRAYELALNNSWSFFQGDFKTRRDIAYKCAEDSHFNFYADRSGDIWFHPQRFDASWILSAPIPAVYIIDNASIVSYGFIEDDTELFTSVYVDTEPDFGRAETTVLGIYRGAFQDELAILKYGQRIFVCSNPIINTKDSAGLTEGDTGYNIPSGQEGPRISTQVYAKSLLQRMLAGKYQGQITLAGRPELDPGRPVYVPMRNMIYYVETVDHSIQYNQTFQTTIHLSYGHKPWEYLPELLTFAGHDDVYLTDAAVLSSNGIVSPQSPKGTLSQIKTPRIPASTTNTTTPPFNAKTFQNALGLAESNNDYSAISSYPAYGRYQFTLPTIQTIAAGLRTQKPNIIDFLNNHDLQDQYYFIYANELYKVAQQNFTSFLGTSVTGKSLLLLSIINYYGLVAGQWLGGTKNVTKFFQNGYDAYDGTTYVSDYIAKFSWMFSTT